MVGKLNKKIKIKILPNGYIEAETINYFGSSCQDVLQSLQILSNSKVIDSEYKDEFYMTESQAMMNSTNEINENKSGQ